MFFFLPPGPLLGGAYGWVMLYLVVRTVESHWFVWVTQMSHLSMNIGKYADLPAHDWPSLQVKADCMCVCVLACVTHTYAHT